jgi:midasin (ATPase involved in ribosome maturation)
MCPAIWVNVVCLRQNNNFAFSFVEGSLVKALRRGDWVLLDEVNLASPETLECLSGLLDGGSVTLTERGDTDPIPRHPDFRLFACMNPPTDIGKKDLPPGLRNRFTEFYIGELLDPEDLKTVVHRYLKVWMIYVCACVRALVCVCVCIFTRVPIHLCVYVSVYLFMRVCIYMCVCEYI